MKRPAIVALLVLSLTTVGSAGGGKLLKKSGLPAPLERITAVLEKLKLTDEQVAKISPIIDQAQTDMMKLQQEAKSAGKKKAAEKGQLQAIRQRTISGINQQLTPDQRKQFQQEVKQIKAK